MSTATFRPILAGIFYFRHLFWRDAGAVYVAGKLVSTALFIIVCSLRGDGWRVLFWVFYGELLRNRASQVSIAKVGRD